MAKLSAYLRVMRLDKPIGIWLLLWPTLWGLWLAAGGMPPVPVLLVFVAGVALMRSAGCAINDVLDADVDPYVARTQSRPIAAGELSRAEGLRLAIAIALIAFGLCTRLDPRTVLLSLPAAVLAGSYPLMKRFIALPQAYLGLAFSWGIAMAYSALRPEIPWGEVALVMAANLCWVIAYDTLYAMVDKPDDLKIGVKSSAIFFGRADWHAVAALKLAALLLLAVLGWQRQLGAPFWCGLGVAAAYGTVLMWQCRSKSPAACFTAFLRNHWLGLAVFIGLALALRP